MLNFILSSWPVLLAQHAEAQLANLQCSDRCFARRRSAHEVIEANPSAIELVGPKVAIYPEWCNLTGETW